MKNILLYCRPGFENECAIEFLDKTKNYGQRKIISDVAGSGYVVCGFPLKEIAELCINSLDFKSLIFPRQMILCSDLICSLPKGNRIFPIINELKKTNIIFSDIFIEMPDTNEGKKLSKLCKSLFDVFKKELKKENMLLENNGLKRLHIFFIATDKAYYGISNKFNASNWQMGIPRLKFPYGAPSRSALKLEEAFYTFLPENDNSLKKGAMAIDLGASPGGWSWVLVNKGLKVIAIDNGKLNKNVLNTNRVTHLKTNAFTFRPNHAFDWMVCDIVEKPKLIANLICKWLIKKWCKYTIFNLKLPMKKKYEEIKKCKYYIMSNLEKNKTRYNFYIKQLYHDREEVTGFINLKK